MEEKKILVNSEINNIFKSICENNGYHENYVINQKIKEFIKEDIIEKYQKYYWVPKPDKIEEAIKVVFGQFDNLNDDVKQALEILKENNFNTEKLENDIKLEKLFLPLMSKIKDVSIGNGNDSDRIFIHLSDDYKITYEKFFDIFEKQREIDPKEFFQNENYIKDVENLFSDIKNIDDK